MSKKVFLLKSTRSQTSILVYQRKCFTRRTKRALKGALTSFWCQYSYHKNQTPLSPIFVEVS